MPSAPTVMSDGSSTGRPPRPAARTLVTRPFSSEVSAVIAVWVITSTPACAAASTSSQSSKYRRGAYRAGTPGLGRIATSAVRPSG
jgi:hypothetical protein